MAMFAAAMMICVPNIEIMIFSVSLNSSRKMLQMIKDMVDAHHEGKMLYKETNAKDKFWLRGGENDRRMCESRPGRGSVRFASAPRGKSGASIHGVLFVATLPGRGVSLQGQGQVQVQSSEAMRRNALFVFLRIFQRRHSMHAASVIYDAAFALDWVRAGYGRKFSIECLDDPIGDT